jgi:tRNA(Ile2) C34 agmatinyltransferase TiaS
MSSETETPTLEEYLMEIPVSDEEYDGDVDYCPACGGEGGYLGELGIVAWFRCRQCGSEFRGSE